MKHRIAVTFILFFVLLAFGFSQEVPKKVLFFFYDAGETLALLPVYEKAEKLNHYKFALAPLTPWSKEILVKQKLSFLDSEINPNNRSLSSRYSIYPNLARWEKLIDKEKPHLIVLGLVSQIQKQIAQFCRQKKIPVIGYYDAFDPPSAQSITREVMEEVDVLFVPNEEIQSALNIEKPVMTVGQPSVETWRKIHQKTNVQEIREKLKIENEKTILFAGQYGNGYEEVLREFLQLAQNLKQTSLILSPHPKTDGSLEAKIVQKMQLSHTVINQEFPSSEASVVADIVITWRSTVGVQAAFAGKTVVYFNLSLTSYRNRLIDEGVAHSTDPKNFLSVIEKIFDQKNSQKVLSNRLKNLGYILNSTEKIYHEIACILGNQ